MSSCVAFRQEYHEYTKTDKPMDRSQQYISTLLERVPKTELSDPEHATAFERIRERLSGGQNLQTQLKELYKVGNFSEFALGLMWIAEKVDNDTSKLNPVQRKRVLF